MLMALNAKHKLGFVVGSISRSSSNNLLSSVWSRCNSMVTLWLLNSVSKEIDDILLCLDNVEAVWTYLHERFHQINAPRIFQIKQQLQELC